MPSKHHFARPHRIPQARYRVQNWPAYQAGLKRRGDLTFWLDETALAGWHVLWRRTPGKQPVYSDLAVELLLTLHLVFHLALRLLGRLWASPTTPPCYGAAAASRQR